MVQSDPIADMLTRIRNANVVHHDHVDIPSSKMKVSIAKILKDEGFIKYYKVMRNNKQGTIRVFLKYGPDKSPVINGLDRVSKPGIRRYIRSDEVPRVRGGMGIVIVSTSHGVLTGKDCRRQNLGGELLCTVW